MPRTERVVFAMHGFSCASCAIDVGRALRKMPGIHGANVNYLVDKGMVEFDPEETSWDSIERALEKRGYRVMRTRREASSIVATDTDVKNLIHSRDDARASWAGSAAGSQASSRSPS